MFAFSATSNAQVQDKKPYGKNLLLQQLLQQQNHRHRLLGKLKFMILGILKKEHR